MTSTTNEEYLTPYIRVISALKMKFPHEPTTTFDNIIGYIRRENRNLKGFTVDDLIENVTDALNHEKVVESTAPPVEVATSEFELCCICRDGVCQDDVKNTCGHKFHSQCLRQWLRYSSTCPTCRAYVLMHDEYPSL